MKNGMEIIRQGEFLGAEIRGVNLSGPLSDDVKSLIRKAYLEYQAIFFRGQNLLDEQLIAFGEIFGELMNDSRPKDYYPELDTQYPETVDVVSNVEIDGKAVGALGSGEAVWHTDTVPIPNSALILHALEVPKTGGNTRFVNMYHAYETLEDDIKAKVDGQIVIHGRSNYTLLADAEQEDAFDPSQSTGPWFPLVRVHGETKKRSIFLGRKGDGYIVNMPIQESEELIDFLWRHATRPEVVWEHRWKKGDVLVWDNRCTAHSRGKLKDGRRRLHRVTVSGEWPQGVLPHRKVRLASTA